MKAQMCRLPFSNLIANATPTLTETFQNGLCRLSPDGQAVSLEEGDTLLNMQASVLDV